MVKTTPGETAYAAFWQAFKANYGTHGDDDWSTIHPAAQAAWEAAALAAAAPAQTARNAVYTERNMLVAFLATCYPSHLARHPDAEPWDDAWRWLVCVHTPAGQMTWHIHDSEYPLFRWLPARANDWDGHTTEEKYTCLLGLIVERRAPHA